MRQRLASLLLILLTIGFFIFHSQTTKRALPKFIDTVELLPSEPMVVDDEFLILMDQGDEKYLSSVLLEFDLHLISPLGEWVHVGKHPQSTQKVIPLSSTKARENLEFIIKLEKHEAIHSAELNYVQNVEPMLSCLPADFYNDKSEINVNPSDTYFHKQWHLTKEQGIDMPGAWSFTTGNANTIIAIVDRNFDSLKADLSLDRCPTRSYYYEDITDYFPFQKAKAPNTHHGNYVLSVLAPCTNNGSDLAGIDWHAQVFLVDTKDDASLSARMFGVLWALGTDICRSGHYTCDNSSMIERNMHPANIINASFGFAGAHLKNPPYGPVLDVVGQVNRNNSILVASAGNEGTIADTRLPGAAGGVISIGASTEKKQSASFSNNGHSVDVFAPGVKILGLFDGKLVFLNGTSFSSPMVAGVVALMLAENPLLSWKHIEYILKITATAMSCEDACMIKDQKECLRHCCKNGTSLCAHGIVNAKEAVMLARQGFPNVALIDVDDYYLALAEDSLTTRVTVKNWGKKATLAHMQTTDKNLKVSPPRFYIPPIDDKGRPGLTAITVSYRQKPDHRVVTKLILETIDDEYHDQIEAMLEIVPDHNPRRMP